MLLPERMIVEVINNFQILRSKSYDYFLVGGPHNNLAPASINTFFLRGKTKKIVKSQGFK
jgi:hypothetical protein